MTGLVWGTAAAAAPVGQSDLRSRPVIGVKWPNSPAEGTRPVVSYARALDLENSGDKSRGFDAMLPFILASPDQEDAGSCLYMSLTGIAEWWAGKLNPSLSRAPDGPLDFSERYLMNLAGIDEDKNHEVANWKTDSVLLFNRERRTVLNSSYRFTKGWYTVNEEDDVAPAKEGMVGASYGTMYNWLDERSKIKDGYVALPEFTRSVVYADPASNQWNVGVAPRTIADQVKNLLATNQAPVHVIYNHYGYWHAVTIVGFNDEASNGHCPFVTSAIDYFKTEPANLRKEAEAAASEGEKDRLLKAAAKAEATGEKLTAAYQAEGGCHGDKGVFYVRDSIYSADSEPVYRYDLTRSGGDGHYSKKVILHEYDWLLYLANHVTQISVVP